MHHVQLVMDLMIISVWHVQELYISIILNVYQTVLIADSLKIQHKINVILAIKHVQVVPILVQPIV